MAKSSTPSLNPVESAISQALASRTIARSTCDALINNYSAVYPDEMDGLLESIRKGKITVLERR